MKIKKIILNKNIKKRAMMPFFVSIFYTVMYYFVIPSFLFIVGVGAFAIIHIPAILFTIFILGLVLYAVSITPRFLPGLKLFRDVIQNSFVTCDIQHENSVINRYYYYPKKESSYRKIKFKQEDFLQVYCRKEDNTQVILLSARYHGMMPGEIYTVVYGKYSKILICILSKDGEELWDIPFESWDYKLDQVFPFDPHKLNKRKKQKKRD